MTEFDPPPWITPNPSPQSYEEQRFYRRANAAIDVAENAAYMGLAWAWWQQGAEERARRKAQLGPMPTATKAWWWGSLCFLGLAAVAFFMEVSSQSTEDFVKDQNNPGHGGTVFFLVLAAVCFVVGLVHGAYEDSQRPPAPPTAPAVAAPPTPPPTPPPVTETRVERSVRVVRTPAAATTHHNSQAPVAALQAPHKDVEQSTDLVVVRHHQRPPLWTEDHGAYRSVDRRSFDRDIGPV